MIAENDRVDLSVCMVTWNACGLTTACLESLVKFTKGISYEVILVDNGSNDGTVDTVRLAFPWVTIIANESDEEFARGSNQALRAATGRYAMLLNNDMLFQSDALSQMVSFMDSDGDVGVLGCRLRLKDGSIQASAHGSLRWQDYVVSALFLNRLFPDSRICGHINSTYIDYVRDDSIIDVDWVVGAALMVRTDTLSHVGLLDEHIVSTGEDWEWCRRYAQNGYRIVYFTGAEIVHYHGVSTIYYTGTNRDAIRYRSIMRALAGTHYVFRKLHPGANTQITLFTLAFRLHCLSRAIAYWVLGVVKPQHADGGSRRAYWAGMVMSYRSLQKQYLRCGSVVSGHR